MTISAEAIAEILADVRGGRTLTSACESHGTSRTSLHHLAQRDPRLARDLAEAVEAGRAGRRDPRAFVLTPERRAVVLSHPTIRSAAEALGVIPATLSREIASDPSLVAEIAVMRQARLDAAREAKPPPTRKPRDPDSFDSRPVVLGDQVEASILAASQAVTATFPGVDSRGPRWRFAGADYGKVRAFFHCLPTELRREALARLVGEEDDRIQHDRGCEFRPAERHQGQAPKGGGHDR
jgi:hypothetical protein